MMWLNCHDTAALIQCCPIINPFSLGTLMVNDYVLLVTRGRGGRGTHNQIYPGKVHRENMDTKHHQANTWKPLPEPQRGPSTNKKEYIPHMSVLPHFLEQCPIMSHIYDRTGFCCWNILVYGVGCNFTTYMRLIWEKRSESEFKTCWMWHKK